MSKDLSPEGINKSHGKSVWRCYGCNAEASLHWHNGFSVAMCNKPECAKAYNDMCAEQIAAQESYEQYCRENCPW
jgi:hypothetical protein